MRIVISDDRVNFLVNKEWCGCRVVRRFLDNSNEKIIGENVQGVKMEGAHDDEILIAQFSFLEFNALNSTLVISKEGGEADFSQALSVFRLHHEQMNSHYYVTVHLFAAGMNRLEGNQLLYQVLCYMQTMPVDWQFYGGLITLAVFRIADRLEARTTLLYFLLDKHREMTGKYHLVDDHSLRWLISSSYNLAVLCVYQRNLSVAERLLDTSLQLGSCNRAFPLTYMNYAQSLLLAGVLKYEAGKISQARHLFSECVDFSGYAIKELLNLRNKFILQHEMDCRVIMDAGYAAMRATVLLKGQCFASDSKLEDVNIDYLAAGYLDLGVIARRYEQQLGGSPPVLAEIAARVMANVKGS